jgi:large subunit ribosomal protein L24
MGLFMNKLRKGDHVIVLTGRDKGKLSVILSRVDENHFILEKINSVKKHVPPNPMKGIVGGIVEKNMPIHQSNIAIYNVSTGEPDKVVIKMISNIKTGKIRRIRTFKSTGIELVT